MAGTARGRGLIQIETKIKEFKYCRIEFWFKVFKLVEPEGVGI